ncbi:MAG TPA: DMT family transporter [Candidatus Atribacteria bacterium]|nr:DMT family transporter [Candidatus Atribacteria bacterium]
MIKNSKLNNVKIDTKDNYKVGIFFILISCICFSLIAVGVKQVGHLPLMEIVFFQNIPAMIIIPIILKKMNISLLGNNKPFLWSSGFLNVIIQLAKFYTFTVMLLADAATIHRLSPFFIFFLSGIFLKEKISFRRIPLFLLAFLGGLLVIKPGFRVEIFPAMIALIAAISIALNHVNLRYLRLTDHYLVITNYVVYIGGLTSIVILLWQKSFQIPNSYDLLILISIGLTALFAQITLTKAYQMAQANLVSLYTYSQIIFASLFGLMFFKEIPDLLSIIGASFIIISGYLNYRFETNK